MTLPECLALLRCRLIVDVPSWLRHCLCLVFPLPSVAKTLPECLASPPPPRLRRCLNALRAPLPFRGLRHRLCLPAPQVRRRPRLAALQPRLDPFGLPQALRGETLPLLCASTAFTAKTLLLPCVPTASVTKTPPLPCALPPPPHLRHRLCLVCSTAFAATICLVFPLPSRLRHFALCISTASAAKTPPLPCVPPAYPGSVGADRHHHPDPDAPGLLGRLPTRAASPTRYRREAAVDETVILLTLSLHPC